MNKIFRFFLRVPLSEQILFAKHLSMMVRAGMPEVDSIRLIRKQVASRGFAAILTRVIADVENGRFLSASLKQFRHAFKDVFISIIEVGETSGTLAENLEYLADELRKAQILRSKIRSALIYPVVILTATLGLTGALVFFVLPRIIPIFSSLRVELPLPTKILIATAGFLLAYYGWILLGVALAIAAWTIIVRIPVVAYAYHRTLISLPFIGRIVVSYNMASIMRTLGLLLKSGIRIVEALESSGNAISNRVYMRVLKEAAESVKRGDALYKYFEMNSALFPPTVSRMIEVGEKTGNLDENLAYLAAFYEDAVDETVQNLSSVFEPVLLLVMGGIVGFIAVSIIAPIYGITQGFQGM